MKKMTCYSIYISPKKSIASMSKQLKLWFARKETENSYMLWKLLSSTGTVGDNDGIYLQLGKQMRQ